MQFVVPGVTQADSSSVYDFEGTYYCWPNRTVDGNFYQNIRNCLHTATTDVTEAWLRIDLQRMRSVKSVKFWYRNDSMCCKDTFFIPILTVLSLFFKNRIFRPTLLHKSQLMIYMYFKQKLCLFDSSFKQ